MTLRKKWDPARAEEWTGHDVWASVFSVFSYLLITVGVAGSLLLRWWGFAALAGGIVCAVLMFLVIDPKLRTISEEFEMKEKEYLGRMEQITRWEDGGEHKS